MSRRVGLMAVLAVSLGLLGTLTAAAQSLYGREEWNDYQAAKQVADPAGKAQAYEGFIQKYPQSVLRAYIYPEMIGALYAAKQRAKLLTTVDEFLKMDRNVFTQVKFTQPQVDWTVYSQHRTYVYVAREMLGAKQQLTPEQIQGTIAHTRAGLEMLGPVISAQKAAAQNDQQIQQLEQLAVGNELVFHQMLFATLWREKKYDEVQPELSYLLEKFPAEANLNYQMGYLQANKGQPDPLRSMWYSARAISLGHANAGSIRQSLTRQVYRHIGALDLPCIQSDVEGLIQQAGTSLHPPAGWQMISSDQVAAARQNITYAGLFTDLAEPGDKAHVTWLAACGIPFGLGEQGEPTYEAVLLSVEEAAGDGDAEAAAGEATEATEGGDSATETPEGEEAEAAGVSSIILKVAATPEALEAKIANMEIVLENFTDLAKLKEKLDQTIKIGGTITAYQSEPFVIRLSDGKVDYSDFK